MTKIDIFSGFLGAGKTTLIKKLIAEAYTGEQLVLIENEFGEIGIDGGFLQEAGISITEMNSGCICCSLVGDFGKALRQVMDTYHPDRILIEPSGVGKLSDVIRAVQNLEMHDVVLNGFTTVVDATKAKMYMRNFGEFFNNQVEHASAIILSRTAGMSQEKLDACVALLREKNPTATIVTTPWDELDGKQLLAAMERRDTLAAALEELAEEPFLLRERGSAGREFLDHVFAAHQLPLTPLWESASTQAIIKAVGAGLGVSFLPEKLVSQAIAEGSVRTVPIENEPFCRTHHIVYHRHKFLTQSAREFIALCHEMEASADVMEP